MLIRCARLSKHIYWNIFTTTFSSAFWPHTEFGLQAQFKNHIMTTQKKPAKSERYKLQPNKMLRSNQNLGETNVS